VFKTPLVRHRKASVGQGISRLHEKAQAYTTHTWSTVYTPLSSQL